MAAKLNQKAIAAADAKFREVTEAPVPTFVLVVVLTDGRRLRFEEPRTKQQCIEFCHKAAHDGLLVTDGWLPAHRIYSVGWEAPV